MLCLFLSGCFTQVLLYQSLTVLAIVWYISPHAFLKKLEGYCNRLRWSVSLLTKERYKTHQSGFLFGLLGHAPGVGNWGYHGGVGGSIFFFSEIQPDLVCELLT